MQYLRNHYDMVVVDTPPLGTVVDAALVAPHCDGAIMLIQSNTVSYRFAQNVVRQIEATGCGVNAQAGDLDALVSSIQQLYQDRTAAERMGKTGREYVLTNLSKEKCTGMYVSTLKESVEEANR